jgi:hypothetical protein
MNIPPCVRPGLSCYVYGCTPTWANRRTRSTCPVFCLCRSVSSGVPERARTSNLLIRSQVLYPIELQVLLSCCLLAVSRLYHQDSSTKLAEEARLELARPFNDWRFSKPLPLDLLGLPFLTLLVR